MAGRWATQLASVTLAAVVVLTGCATMRQWQARDTEQLLAAGGFKMQLADTAEQEQHLAATPPYRLVSRPKNGTFEYTYTVRRTASAYT